MDEISTLLPLTVLKDDKHVAGWKIRDVIEGDIKGHPQYFQHPLGEQYVKIYDKLKKFLDERTGYKLEERAKKEREQDEEWRRKTQEEERKKQEEGLRQMEQEKVALLSREKQLITDLYNKFKQAYESRNDSLVMSFLADKWSAGDGTTIADLHDNLKRTFKTYNEIRYNLQNFRITDITEKLYHVSYDVTITSIIYALDIKHEEKSSVVEEVIIEGPNRAKINRTISGRFWYIE